MKKKFILAFIASFICFAILYSTVLSSLFQDAQVIATDDDPNEQVEPGQVDTKIKNEILFLMMGVDANDVKDSKGTRTDTMMLTKVNLETGNIDILSIPRDTRLSVNGKLNKVNAAHAIGGPELSLETVSDFLGIEIDYYVKVDYKIVQEVVDAIGGVEIDVPLNMKYNDPTSEPPLNINIKKGLQVLDGKNAHDFLRWRHNNSYTIGYPEGDVGRIQAQQYFIKELVKQTLKTKNILKLPTLIETYFENVETNIPIGIMLKGAAAAKNINVENMKTATVPGVGEYVGDTSYYIYSREETNQIVVEMFGDYLFD